MLPLSRSVGGNNLGNKDAGYSRALYNVDIFTDHQCLLWLMAAFICVATLIAFFNPLFESTDEIRHYRFIRILVTEQRLPVQGAELLRAQSHHPPLYHALSALASAWIPSSHTGQYDHPSNPYWGYRNWEVGVDNKLQYRHASNERFDLDNLAAYIPRLVNAYLGALTTGITYALGVRLWPKRKLLALGSAALVAFNPQFIYLSAAINNDIIAALTGTAVLFVCVVILQDGLTKPMTIWIGLVFGIAVLSKIHLVMFFPVIYFTLVIAIRKTHNYGAPRRILVLLRSLSVVGVTAGIVAGWWFIRNLLLYGDFTGMNQLNEMWGGRSAEGSFWALKQGLPYLWSSLWGRFGYGQIPLAPVFYAVVALLCLVGILGNLRTSKTQVQSPVVGIFVLAIGLFLLIVSYYILIQPAGAMGRFMFPVYPAFAVLVIAGWSILVPSPRWIVLTVCMTMVLFTMFAFVLYLCPAVGYPKVEYASSLAPKYQLGDVAQISEISVSPQSIDPGEAVFLSVTWHPLRQTDEPVIVYVHLIDEVGAVIAQRDTYPGLGRAPTTSWKVDRPFVDRYRIDVPESAYSPNTAQVKLGMYTTAERLPLYDLVNDKTIPEGLGSGDILVRQQAGQWPNPLDINFGNQFTLIGYEIQPRQLRAGDNLELTLYWKTAGFLSGDYDIFAQVLDENWRVWGSQDGGHPEWIGDSVITDTRSITLLPDTPPGTYPVQVGLFNSQGRLPILTKDGLHLDDRYQLGPIHVE